MRNSPDNSLSPAEVENLKRLEAVAQRGLRTYTDVSEALAEIRDAQLYRGTHHTFEAYLRERWAIDSDAPVRGEDPEAVANVFQQVLRALDSSELTVADIRLTLHRLPLRSDDPVDPSPSPTPSADLVDGRFIPQLRWLLTQSGGTIADVAHQLETNPFEVDDRVREQLLDDVLVVEEELDTLKALLAVVDWDAEFKDLLGEGNSSPEADADTEDE